MASPLSKPRYVAISPLIKMELKQKGIPEKMIYEIPNGVLEYYNTFDEIPKNKNSSLKRLHSLVV